MIATVTAKAEAIESKLRPLFRIPQEQLILLRVYALIQMEKGNNPGDPVHYSELF